MRVVVDGTVFEGPAVDLRDRDVNPAELLAGIHNDGPAGENDREEPITVETPSPHPVHERVGYIHGEMGLRVRTALAAAARSRGLSAPQDDELSAVRERLAAMDPPTPDTEAERRAVAETGGETTELREQVAELRGQLKALEKRDDHTDDLRAELRDVAGRLTEVETEAVAARQQLERASRAARSARDAREERMRLEDRAANLARDARAHLVERLAGEFADAVASVPGPTPEDPFEVDTVTGALAVARVAALSAPVVLACDRFETAEAARACLDGPVVRL